MSNRILWSLRLIPAVVRTDYGFAYRDGHGHGHGMITGG